MDQGLCWALYMSPQLLLRTQTDNYLHIKWKRKWIKEKQLAFLSHTCHSSNRELFMLSYMFHTVTHTSPLILYLRPSTSLKKPSLTAPTQIAGWGRSLLLGFSALFSLCHSTDPPVPSLSPLLDHELLEGMVLSKPQVPSTESGKY